MNEHANNKPLSWAVVREVASTAIQAYIALEAEADGDAPDERALETVRKLDRVCPTIVCLCGSTRFWREFQAANLRETLAGKIVLSVSATNAPDDELFGALPPEEYDCLKAMFDELHLRKIDLADEVLILNVGGYIGASTKRELAYAWNIGRHVRFLEDHTEA